MSKRHSSITSHASRFLAIDFGFGFLPSENDLLTLSHLFLDDPDDPNEPDEPDEPFDVFELEEVSE